MIDGLGQLRPVTERERENREMGGSGGLEEWADGLETWFVCRRRLGLAWANDIEAGRGVGLGRLRLVTLRPMEMLSTE